MQIVDEFVGRFELPRGFHIVADTVNDDIISGEFTGVVENLNVSKAFVAELRLKHLTSFAFGGVFVGHDVGFAPPVAIDTVLAHFHD